MGENQTTRLKYLMRRTYVQSDLVNGAGQLQFRMQRVVVSAIGVSTKVLVGRPVDTDDAVPSSGTLNMNDGCDAQMSVVLVTPDRYDAIRKTLEHLRAQTVLDQLEIVIVALSAATLNFDAAELSAFGRVRVIEVGEIKSTGRAIAAGVQEASAPVVTYAEEHSYPAPGWAEALIKAHRQSWAVVGAAIANANPGNMISWASLFTDFGPWVEPAEAGEIGHLPWHHAA